MIRWTAGRHPGIDGPAEADPGVLTMATLESGGVYATTSGRYGEAAVVLVRGSVDGLGSSGPSLAAGDAVFLPHDAAFSVCNHGSTDAQLLILYAPGSVRFASEPTLDDPRVVRRRDVRPRHLDRSLGFHGVKSTLMLTNTTVGARGLLVGWAEFEPGGQHALHRHRFAAEVLHVLSAEGCRHLSAGSSVPLVEGDLTLVQAGEWHGLHNAGQRPAEVVFAYLGVGSIDADGYELDGS